MTGAIPFRLSATAAPPEIEWIITDGARFTEPFLDQTITRLRCQNPANARARRRQTSLEALRTVAPGAPPAAFIFHVSRCGSTLLAQMLAALPRNIVASEPQIIDELLRAGQLREASDEDRIAWLRGAVHSLGQPNAAGGDRLFIKLDCWAIFSLPLIERAFPGVPKLFVYRDPLEVLVSLLRRPSLLLVHETIAPAQLGLTAAERDGLGTEAYIAAALGAFFREAHRHRAHLVPVAYPQLPAWVGQSFPGVAFDAGELRLMENASRRNAKQPGEVFAPDAARKRAEAGAAARAAIAAWTQPHYARWLAGAGVPAQAENGYTTAPDQLSAIRALPS